MQARWDYIFINYNMYRRNINIKLKYGQQTGKALSNYERFSPSQSHETVPLSCVEDVNEADCLVICVIKRENQCCIVLLL